ncbi:hypothetical protein KXV29_007963 [Aspergillus fumigatus]|nr:hypothetical protein KXV29_007963 [Aspergillus fumigatus]
MEPRLKPTPSKSFLRYHAGWRRVVSHFSPSWFSTTMGTGIVAILFHLIPFGHTYLHYVSIVFFIFNVVLFAVVLSMSILRYTLYPEIWAVMIQDPTNSLFLATCPMGFATLIEMWVFVCVPAWGDWARTVAWVLWIVDAVAAASVTVSLSFILSYILWGMGTPLAMTILVIYYQRLAVHKLPSRETIVSCFLPLGPLGFGGFGILYLGKVLRKVVESHEAIDPIAGSIAYTMGLFISLLMWSFGLIWLVFALATIYHASPFPFNMGWWGFTFPLGVYAANTLLLGQQLDLMFFRIFGMILSVAVVLLWLVVAARTVHGAWRGSLFYAPCLQNLKNKEDPAEAPIRQA